MVSCHTEDVRTPAIEDGGTKPLAFLLVVTEFENGTRYRVSLSLN